MARGKFAHLTFILQATLCALLLGSTAVADDSYRRRLGELEEKIRRRVAEDEVVGLSIAFFKDDFVWSRAFGHANLETRSPALPETSYRMASVTKPMTAVAILQLVEQGKIDLDADIQTYVPYFPRKKWPVTPRLLLGHLGGICSYQNSQELRIRETLSTREAIAIFEGYDLVAEPRTRFHYSSYGYNLLGAAIEKASGMSYGDYMQKHIWGPLEMTATRMDDPRAIIPNRARGYTRDPAGQLRNSAYVDISSRFAAGGTRSTVEDMLKFARGILDHQVLSPETTRTMLDTLVRKDGVETDYALGWELRPWNRRFSFGHGGSQPETRTALRIFPSRRFAVALACNYEVIPDRTAFIRLVYETVMGEPAQRPVFVSDPLTDVKYRALEETHTHGLAYFDRFGQELKTNVVELNAGFYILLNVLTSKDAAAARTALRTARHPADNESLVRVGSFMASVLLDGADEHRRDYYYRRGPLEFFHDFCRHPKGKRYLSKEVAQEIDQWYTAWLLAERQVRADLDVVGTADVEILRKSLEGITASPIRPDLRPQLRRAAKLSRDQQNGERAVQLTRLGVDLYPEAARPKVELARLYLELGKNEDAAQWCEKALEIEPDHVRARSMLEKIRAKEQP